MPRCCGGATCACSIQAGTHVTITGTGQAQDPFVVNSDVGLSVLSGTDIALALTGLGTVASPWVLQASFNSTAKLRNLPDVNAPAPTNNQVLGWDNATQKWTARNPTTAASGSVTHDTSITGDGSAGSPLGVVMDSARYLSGGASGIGVSTAGQNSMVLHYANAATRSVSTLTPSVNAQSVLDDTPGVTWYWTGTQWSIVTNGVKRDFGSSQMLALSGAYVAGGQTTMIVRQISATTNTDGTFTVLSSSDLATAAGVLYCAFTESGSVPFKALLNPSSSIIQGTAYRIDDGTVLASQAISGTALAYLY